MMLSAHFEYSYEVVTYDIDVATLGAKVTENGLGAHTFVSSSVNPEKFDFSELLRAEGSGSVWVYMGQNSEGIFIERTNVTYFFSNNPNLDNTIQDWEMTDYEATCFLEGVRIACEDGERAVETLNLGDRVRLADGSLAPIRWIGRQPWVTLFADPLSVMPVRIAAGALAEGAPSRDLYLSPDHAVLVGDVLVHAGALVNGTTITRMTRRELPERFTYFHIELEAHAVVLAEGAPCESFVPNVSRARFENFPEYLAMFGEEQEMDELAYPRAASARQIPPPIRTVIAQRADALGSDLAAA